MRERMGALLALGAISFVACRAEKTMSPVFPSPENNNSITLCGTDPNLGQYEFEIRHSEDVDVIVIGPTSVEASCEPVPAPTTTHTPSGV